MVRMKLIGLCLLCAVAISLAATSAALAYSPVWVTKASPGTTVAPTLVSAEFGAVFLEGKTSRLRVECAGRSFGTFEATAPKTSKHNIAAFKRCEIAGLALPCENDGAGSREITTNSLEGTLGELGSGKPGELLKPEAGTIMASFECDGGGVRIAVENEVIGAFSGSAVSGELPPENNVCGTLKLTFKQSLGQQTYTHFEGGVLNEHRLTSVISEGPLFIPHTEQSGLSGVASLKTYIGLLLSGKDIGVTK